MSFLQQLQQQRAALQTVNTTVTTITGARFIESKTLEMPAKQLDNLSYGFVLDTKPDAVPACILDDFLYLGSQDAVTMENVKFYGITHILSVGIDVPRLEELNVQQKFLPCLDLPETPILEKVVPDAIQFINAARPLKDARVLVHCNAGVSRSASVIIAYLLQCEKMSFDEAYSLVKQKRACIQPNKGFMQQLKTCK